MKDSNKIDIQKNSVMLIVKGVLFAVILTLGFVLLYAAALYFFDISDKLIPFINQVIKGVSIFLGCLLSIRGTNNGWLKGFLIGLLYITIAFVMFSALNQSFEYGLELLNDIAIGSLSGLASGVICANLGKH
ncbi:MAG: TIGR04086 family membrane protein [Clostridiales bacterium]|jgi:putative membrane protein (TIGR04086 family)|nr:TIGR04086 family membrane protein [Clostridiales bacterium]